MKIARSARWLWFGAALLTSIAARSETLDRVVAVVDDSVILQSELDREISLAQATMRGRGIDVPDNEQLQPQVLEHLILVRLQLSQADHNGIKIDDRDLDDAIARVADNNHMSLGAFAAKMKEDGVSFTQLRSTVREELTIQRLREKEVAPRVYVSEQDVDLYLANNSDDDRSQYRVSHILVAVPENATSETRQKARKKADDLLARIKGGEDFARVAATGSDDAHALQGGDLGWKKGSELPTLLAHVVPPMKEGDVSDIIQDQAGYHIVKLTARKSDTGRQTTEETHVRHILLRPDKIRDEKATRTQIDSIAGMIKHGTDFAELARKYSDDPGSRLDGGDLGWQPPGVFAPDFQTQVDLLKPGETSTPFRTSFGWHVAEVLGRRTRDITDEQRRMKAKETIFLRREQEEYEDYVRKLRDEAYVEYRLARTDDGSSKPASGSSS